MRVKSVKVKINREAMAQLNKAKERALELTAEAMLSDIKSRAVVPKDIGDLERSGFVDKGQISAKLVAAIIFDMHAGCIIIYRLLIKTAKSISLLLFSKQKITMRRITGWITIWMVMDYSGCKKRLLSF